MATIAEQVTFETVTEYLAELDNDYSFVHGFIAALFATKQIDEALMHRLMDWMEKI